MNPECQPSRRAKRDPQRRRDLDRVLALEVRANDHTLLGIEAVVVRAATRVQSQSSVFAEHGVDLDAGVGCGEGVVAADDGRGREHDEADGYDDGELDDGVSRLVYVLRWLEGVLTYAQARIIQALC